jgi:hypothetical protein
MKETTDCDFNRTPAIFWIPDIYRFVRGVSEIRHHFLPVIAN